MNRNKPIDTKVLPIEVDRRIEVALALGDPDEQSMSVDQSARAETGPAVPEARLRPIENEELSAPVHRSLSGNRTGQTPGKAGTTNAAELIRRHALPQDLAEAVAGGRLTLQSALVLCRSRLLRPKKPALRLRNRVLPTALVVTCLASGLFVRLSWTEYVRDAEKSDRSVAEIAAPPSPQHPSRGSDSSQGILHVKRLPLGEVVRVAGPNPVSTLDGYCEQARGCAQGVPKRVVAASTSQPGLRLGLFGDPVSPDRPLAVVIRRDPESRRWTIGDGRRLRVFDLDDLPYPSSHLELD